MSDDDRFVYDYEALDGGEPIFVSYGSDWIQWLVGAVAQLTTVEAWSPDCDQEQAVLCAQELIVRLMEGNAEMTQVLSHSAVEVPIAGVRKADTLNYTLNKKDDTFAALFSITSDFNDTPGDWVEWDMLLSPGTYSVMLWFQTYSNRGKIELKVSGSANCPSLIKDQYTAVRDKEAYQPWTVIITETALYTLTIYKHYKNPASSNGMVEINKIVVKKW